MTEWETIVKPQRADIREIVPVIHLTTVNTYVEVTDLDTRWLTDTNIIIGVTTKSLDYQVLVYNDYTSGVALQKATGTIAAAAQAEIVLKRHARVKIEVKPTSADQHGTCHIDVIAGR